MNVILLMGSFNPIVYRDFVIANEAISYLQKTKNIVATTWFIPYRTLSYNNNILKKFIKSYEHPTQDTQYDACSEVSFEHRTAMVQEALLSYKTHRIKLYKLESSTKNMGTYMIIKNLMKQFPNYTFYYLLWEDQAAQIDRLRKSRELRRLLPFVVVYDDSTTSYGSIGRWVGSPPHIELYLSSQAINYSTTSHTVRTSLKAGVLPAGSTFASVEHYIKSNKLYTKKGFVYESTTKNIS